MAYTAPTLETFTGVFPAFAAVTEDQYTFWSAQAVLVTEPLQDCLGDRMDLATMLATAHYLVEQGIGAGAESEMAAQGMGGFKSIRSGSIALDRGDAKAVESAGSWGSSSYGLRLWPMLRACVAGPRVTATGALPCGIVAPIYPFGC
jgi:hypothetical protein